MLHAEDTIERWLEMERAEHEYRRWAAFFYPLIDRPEQAQLLYEVGLSVVRRQIQAGAEARTAVERILRPSLDR
jgi:hypothetical protein